MQKAYGFPSTPSSPLNSCSGSTHWAGCFAELPKEHKRLPNKKKIVWMLLVFSHFFVPTMQLCPPGRSVLRPNTECYFPIPSPQSGPDDSPAPALQTPTAHTLPSQDRAQPTLPDPHRRHNLHPAEPHAQATAGEKQGVKPALMTAAIPAGAGFPLHQGEGAPGGFTRNWQILHILCSLGQIPEDFAEDSHEEARP